MAFFVRAASELDRPGVLALAYRLEEGVSPWRDRSGVARAVRSWVESSIGSLGDGERACFVAEECRQVIGFVSVERSHHWSGGTDAYIGELMVAEAAARRGVGRALLGEAIAWGQAQGCDRIALETGSANDSALAFYRSMAFECDEVRLSRQL
ncbi:MAG: GNAT family N-acetyltransferase [Acidimicrobiales bacterium]